MLEKLDVERKYKKRNETESLAILPFYNFIKKKACSLLGYELSREEKDEIIESIRKNRVNQEKDKLQHTLDWIFPSHYNGEEGQANDSLGEIKDINDLFISVAKGEQDRVRKFVNKYPDVAKIKANFNDPFTRNIFQKITIFQYALFVLDYDMWNAIADGNLDESQVYRQCLELEENHIDWNDLIVKIKEYNDYYNKYKMYHELSKEFDIYSTLKELKQKSRSIAELQAKLPTHVLDHYVDRESPFFSLGFQTDGYEPKRKQYVNYFHHHRSMDQVFYRECYSFLTYTPSNFDWFGLNKLLLTRKEQFSNLIENLAPKKAFFFNSC